MMYKIKYLKVLFLLLVCGCAHDVQIVPLKGELQGSVFGYNPNTGFELLENAEVTLEGTDPELTLTTDANGGFNVPDLEMGTYHLKFSKPGYGTYKLMGFTFVGGEQVTGVSATLYPIPDIDIEDFQVALEKYGNGVVYLAGSVIVDLGGTPGVGFLRYYIDTQSAVSPLDYRDSGILTSLYGQSSQYFSVRLNTTKFPAGTEIYLTVYPAGDQFSYYVDLETGKRIYASIGNEGSQVIKLKVP